MARPAQSSAIIHTLEHATNKNAAKLPDLYYREVNECLGLVREYMNLIENHYHGTGQGYEHFILEADGDTLITMLKWGLRHREHLLSQEIYVETTDQWSDA